MFDWHEDPITCVGYYPSFLTSLKSINKNNPDFFKNKTIFYPCCGKDETLHLLKEEENLETTKIVHNDIEINDYFYGERNPLEHIVEDYRKGDCNEIFDDINYDILYLCDSHNFNRGLFNKAKNLLICQEGHFLYNLLLGDYLLIGVFEKSNPKKMVDLDLKYYEEINKKELGKRIDFITQHNFVMQAMLAGLKPTVRSLLEKVPENVLTSGLFLDIFKKNGFLYLYQRFW